MSADRQLIMSALAAAHPDQNGFEVLSVDSVGPRVGAELRHRAFLAVACTTLIMGLYIAFRFERSFGVGAVIALIHDVMIASVATVDSAGCSQSQFCAKVDVTISTNRHVCRKLDWKNEEPIGNRHDCAIDKGTQSGIGHDT